MLLSSRYFIFSVSKIFVYYTARPATNGILYRWYIIPDVSARHVRILYRLAFSVRILYRLVYYTFPQGTCVYYTVRFSARYVRILYGKFFRKEGLAYYTVGILYQVFPQGTVYYTELYNIPIFAQKKAGISPSLNHDNRITCKSFINKTAMLKKLDT